LTVDIVPSKREISITDGFCALVGLEPAGELDEDGSIARDVVEATAITATTGSVP
jgi:hypothetical protein